MGNNTSELRSQWSLLASSSTGIFFSVLVLPYYTIGALVVPVTQDMGWTRAAFLAATFFSAGLGAITAPLVGWLADRYGARRVALPGVAGLGIGFLIAATAGTNIWVIYFAYACMAVLGAGTLPVTWTKAITDNFSKQRGLALGIALCGTGICGILMPQFTTYIVETWGWQTAYVSIGLLPLLIGLPIAYLGFRPRHNLASLRTDTPADAQNTVALPIGLTLKEAIEKSAFWILLLSIFLVYMAASGIGANLYPAITDSGLSTAEAATIQSLFGAAVIAGRLMVGYLVDRFWAPGVAGAVMLLPVVGCWILIDPGSFIPSAIAAMLIGIGAGAELDLMSFLAARYFGRKHYALIYSVLYMALAICSGAAPLVFASIFDQTASYGVSFTIAMVLFALGSVSVLFMGRYPQEYGVHDDIGTGNVIMQTTSQFQKD